jgi:hypothetical protein
MRVEWWGGPKDGMVMEVEDGATEIRVAVCEEPVWSQDIYPTVAISTNYKVCPIMELATIDDDEMTVKNMICWYSPKGL